MLGGGGHMSFGGVGGGGWNKVELKDRIVDDENVSRKVGG